MSKHYIEKMLEMKGNRDLMEVPQYAHHPEDHWYIECGGLYRGYPYYILFRVVKAYLDEKPSVVFAYRTGHVGIPTSQVKYIDKICDELKVHGGITNQAYMKNIKTGRGARNSYQIGFDCNHGYDRPDIKSCKRYFPELRDAGVFHEELYDISKGYGMAARTKSYCVKQCKSLIDQIITKIDASRQARRMKKFKICDTEGGIAVVVEGHTTEDGYIYIEDMHSIQQEDKHE